MYSFESTRFPQMMERIDVDHTWVIDDAYYIDYINTCTKHNIYSFEKFLFCFRLLRRWRELLQESEMKIIPRKSKSKSQRRRQCLLSPAKPNYRRNTDSQVKLQLSPKLRKQVSNASVSLQYLRLISSKMIILKSK